MESGRSRSAYVFFTFHLPRPASGPPPFHFVRPLGLGTTGFVGDWWRIADYKLLLCLNTNKSFVSRQSI